MARLTMAALITRVRELIGDEGTLNESDEVIGQHFTDNRIQAALDARARTVVELPLVGERSRTSLGVEQFLVWHANIGAWEADAILLDEQLVPIANESDETFTEDAMTGVWTFAATQEAVYASGRTYDLYGSAADLLDEWATSASGGSITAGGTIVEWETDGQRVKRASATVQERRSLASAYRAMSLPTVAGLNRTDMIPEPRGPFGWY